MTAAKAADQVKAAVDKADGSDGTTVTMAEYTMRLGSTGRPFQIRVPADLHPVEALDLASWITNPATGLLAKLAVQRPSGLVVPGPAGLVRPS